MSNHILVIGASLLDTKGKPTAGLEPGTSNPATIRSTRGGTARNVAENLALLGAKAVLVSAVGGDATGYRLMEDTAEAGVDISYIRIVPEARTGGYIALLDEDGHLSVALDDTAVMDYISPDYLRQNSHLFATADLVMVDGGLTQDALNTAISLATQHHIPICADPSSTRLAPRLAPHLPNLTLIVPNEAEAAQLCHPEFLDADHSNDHDHNLQIARRLNEKGVKKAVISLADYGLVYATAEESGYLPATYSEIIDSTGTGDAITAAIIFGMLNDMETIECMRLGASAAGLTLQTAETVVPNLSLDLLYDHLR